MNKMTDQSDPILPHHYLEVGTRPSEVRSPADAAWLLLTRGSFEVYYAPGDATLYKVSLVSPIPWRQKTRRFEALIVRYDTQHLLIERPPPGMILTPLEWLEAGHPMGWWAGLRPLLAGMGWAIGDAEYDQSDAREIWSESQK